MAARKPNVADRDLSVADQKEQAAQEAGAVGDTDESTLDLSNASVETKSEVNEDRTPLPPPANDGVGNGIDSDGEARPASLSMATESDVSGDADRAKDRAEMRDLRAERDNYKRENERLARENRELMLKLEGAAMVGSGRTGV